MIFAQIKDQVVQNTLVLDDESLVPMFQTNLLTGDAYDLVLRIDCTYPRPGIGWTFDGIIFIAPVVEEVEDV